MLHSLTTTDDVTVPMSEFFVGQVSRQVYVQHWRPSPGSAASRGPVILIHGGFHTGITWTTTPDGRAGWAPKFAALGWDVFVVDWPGTGRSGGLTPECVAISAIDVVDGLLALVEQTGPAVLVGHSIGAALSLKVAERLPSKVRAIAGLAPASVESPVAGWDSAPMDQCVVFEDEVVRALFANSDAFPHHAFTNYLSSIVPLTPRIFNASLGLNADLKTEPDGAPGWGSRIPLLLLIADQDQLIPESRAEETSAALGVPITRLATDWGLPGHGHNFIVEIGSEEIANRVDAWLGRELK